MADSTVIDVDPSSTVDFNTDRFPFPPFDDSFFSQNGDGNDVVPLDDLDFDLSFDDLDIAMLENVDDPSRNCQTQLEEPQADQFRGVFKSSSPELRHVKESCDLSKQSLEGSVGLSSHADSVQVLDYLNVDSPANGDNGGSDEKRLNCPSPDTQGSGNYASNVSEESNNCAVSSININCSVVDLKVEREFICDDNYSKNISTSNIDGSSSCVLKRKNEGNESGGTINRSKYRKSNNSDEGKSGCNNDNNNGVLGEEYDEKRKSRLMRNRESAQLSRQRKKHYVEELEEKVKSMHSTIQDLHSKISYFMSENATLRQQMCSGGDGSKVAPSPVVPPPGMYPHHPMMYPWMACPPPYMMKPQGSQVPLVPIPRLKPQQATHPSKPSKKETSKKADGKKNDGPKTKKVAGVSLLGLLFFFMLVVGLVPMVNQSYGGLKDVLIGEGSYRGSGLYKEHYGRVLMVNGTEYGEANGSRRDSNEVRNLSSSGRKVHSSKEELSADEFVRLGNGSEPLAASLYVPRNDKLVKIDGNLIIHSVLASEKAMASHQSKGEETGLVPVVGHPHLRALNSGSATKEHLGPTTNDGKLHQWFREGFAAPMVNAGMCTEVFQFDVSAASSSVAIVEASSTTSANISQQHNKNSTELNRKGNRRILHGLPIPIPIPESTTRNITSTDSSGQKEGLNGNSKNSSSSSSSSMVVSVLFDPREAGDSDIDGVMGTKSLSRIFVVVLIDSVKYVTYSCMLPLVASAPLVTA